MDHQHSCAKDSRVSHLQAQAQPPVGLPDVRGYALLCMPARGHGTYERLLARLWPATAPSWRLSADAPAEDRGMIYGQCSMILPDGQRCQRAANHKGECRPTMSKSLKKDRP
jgi:hypothetical protein